jgi:hypothetical protein
MKRVEQGDPLETLDLRTCFGASHAVRLLSEIVVDVWDLAKILLEAKENILFTWNSDTRGYFVYDSDDRSEEDDDRSDGDDEDDSHTGLDDQEDDRER